MRFNNEIKQLVKSAKITNFPIALPELRQIINHFEWEIYSYKEATEIIDGYNLKEMADKNDSFVSVIDNRIIIFYNSNISQLDFPYILAHEIGHIVLGHLSSSDDIYTKERDCNCFSEELLKYSPKTQNNNIATTLPIVMLILAVAIWFICIWNYDKNHVIVIENSMITTEEDTYNTEKASYPNEFSTVYVTKYGKKYHRSHCIYIKNKDNILEISVEEATKAGYEPCEVCIGENK